MKKSLLCAFLFLLSLSVVFSKEYHNGQIRLVLHEPIGRFSLYYTADTEQGRYEPFFLARDPRTSFITLNIDDKLYRLGESSVFKTRIIDNNDKPSIVFESPFATVTQEFSFINTTDSPLANGINIKIRIENKSKSDSSIGLRFLLDTHLGESEAQHFETNIRAITGETQITSHYNARFWVSRNKQLGLMGSINTPGFPNPDTIYFANWKRLNDAPWKININEGRNFNFLPYSISDSAIAYYYEPSPLGSGNNREYTVLLAAENKSGFSFYEASLIKDLPRVIQESVESLPPQVSNNINPDLILIRDILGHIDFFIDEGVIPSTEELNALELVIRQIKIRNKLE